MNSKHLSELVNFVCEITYKNEGIVLVDELFHVMLQLIELWNWAKEKEQLLNDLIRHYVIKHSHCKNPEHIDYLCKSLIKHEKDVIIVVDVENRLKWIDNQPDIPQRSKAWYDYRHGVITASSMHQIFHTESSWLIVLKEKVLPLKQFKTNAACAHGIKYEFVAQCIYEKKFGVKIKEYGCIKHPYINYIGASPDGIVRESDDPKMKGRMLEIKCLYSRIMTGVPLYKYWIQVQIQLEVCNLEYCDFLECKINDSHNENDFYIALCEKKMPNEFYGIVIEYTHDFASESKCYKYSLLGQSVDELKEWKNNTIDELLEDHSVEFNKISYWNLDKCSVRTIKRNREWFNSVKSIIEKFWHEVEEKRRVYDTNPNIFNDDKINKTNNSKPLHLISNNSECMIDDTY